VGQKEECETKNTKRILERNAGTTKGRQEGSIASQESVYKEKEGRSQNEEVQYARSGGGPRWLLMRYLKGLRTLTKVLVSESSTGVAGEARELINLQRLEGGKKMIRGI